MSGYLTERQFNDVIELPISIPAVELPPGYSVVLGVVQLDGARQRLTNRVLQLWLVGRDPATPSAPTKLGAGGYAYVEFYDAAGVAIAGSRVDAGDETLSIPVAGILETELTVPGSDSAPVTVTAKLVNNCVDVTLIAVVVGSIRLDLNVNP